MHPFITKTPSELRAQAVEYRKRGLLELAKSCEKQALYVAKRNKRSGKKVDIV